MMQFNDQGLILRWSPFRESDASGVILSRHHGLFFLIAKGALKSRKRFGGSVDLFHHIHFHATSKNSRGPYFLNEAKLHNPFLGIRQSYDRFWMASFCAKTVLDMMDSHLDENASPYPFLLLGSAFQWLHEIDDRMSGTGHLWVGCVFLIQWYQYMGLFPDLTLATKLFHLECSDPSLWKTVMENPLSNLIRNQEWKQLPVPTEAGRWFDALSKFHEGAQG